MSKTSLAAVALSAAMLAATAPAQAICGLAVPSVLTSVAANPGGTTWHYDVYAQGQLSTCGTTPPALALTDYYLPFFFDMGVVNLTTASGWTVTRELTNDRFGLGGGVLHFKNSNPIAPVTFDNLSTHASFDAAFAGTKGPFLVSTINPETHAVSDIFGDPLIPASPLTLAALQAVPEPGSALLLAAGLVVVARRTRVALR